MDIFRVVSPGSFTTVQDRGRYSFIDRGVPPSGALDLFAAGIANLLVGNPAGSAVLEATVMGPALEVLGEADVALTGADMATTINREPVPCWQSIRVKEGDLIRLRQAKSGCRAYLSVTGGIDVPVVMGSRATCVKAKIGGLEGRPLKKGDVIARVPGNPWKNPGGSLRDSSLRTRGRSSCGPLPVLRTRFLQPVSKPSSATSMTSLPRRTAWGIVSRDRP